MNSMKLIARDGTLPPMDTRALDDILLQTLDDLRLSRAEKRGLKTFLQDADVDAGALAQVRSRAFALAGERAAQDPEAVVRWLEGVVKVTSSLEGDTSSSVAEAWFSPGEGCRNRIAGLLGAARRSVDICVFTVTDDHLSEAIVDAHRRGVRVRIISDNDKAEDRGSDVNAFERHHGLPVVVDRTDNHMHHKFAIFDGKMLLTGSYNWTRSAFKYNEENVVVTDDSRLVKRFQREFDKLWAVLS